jgi:hypothetical protein
MSEPTRQWKTGDKVRLKGSSGVCMVVANPLGPDSYRHAMTCVWLDSQHHLQKESIPSEALDAWEEEK